MSGASTPGLGNLGGPGLWRWEAGDRSFLPAHPGSDMATGSGSGRAAELKASWPVLAKHWHGTTGTIIAANGKLDCVCADFIFSYTRRGPGAETKTYTGVARRKWLCQGQGLYQRRQEPGQFILDTEKNFQL